jgi:hypothetical protein
MMLARSAFAKLSRLHELLTLQVLVAANAEFKAGA